MKIQYSCGHPAISFRKTKVLLCKLFSFLFVEKLLGRCCLIDMHISKVTFYSKINISLCSLSKSLHFPDDDIYDNRTVCLKHRVTLNFSQAYICPWKRFLLSTQQCTLMAHMTAWKLGKKEMQKCCAKSSSLGTRQQTLLATRFITTRKPLLINVGLLIHCLVGSCSVAPSSG